MSDKHVFYKRVGFKLGFLAALTLLLCVTAPKQAHSGGYKEPGYQLGSNKVIAVIGQPFYPSQFTSGAVISLIGQPFYPAAFTSGAVVSLIGQPFYAADLTSNAVSTALGQSPLYLVTSNDVTTAIGTPMYPAAFTSGAVVALIGQPIYAGSEASFANITLGANQYIYAPYNLYLVWSTVLNNWFLYFNAADGTIFPNCAPINFGQPSNPFNTGIFQVVSGGWITTTNANATNTFVGGMTINGSNVLVTGQGAGTWDDVTGKPTVWTNVAGNGDALTSVGTNAFAAAAASGVMPAYNLSNSVGGMRLWKFIATANLPGGSTTNIDIAMPASYVGARICGVFESVGGVDYLGLRINGSKATIYTMQANQFSGVGQWSAGTQTMIYAAMSYSGHTNAMFHFEDSVAGLSYWPHMWHGQFTFDYNGTNGVILGYNTAGSCAAAAGMTNCGLLTINGLLMTNSYFAVFVW